MMYKRYTLLLVMLLAMVILNIGSFLFVQPGVASASSLRTAVVSNDCVSLNCPNDTTNPNTTP